MRLVKVRNPWGENQYNGPWSESSGDWTAELKAEVDRKLGNVGHGDAGVFYMDITTYRKNFDGTDINEDVSNWDLSYFLMLGDTKTETKADDFGLCSACTEHIMEVKNPSDESQKVFVGTHVWQARTYSVNNDQCKAAISTDGDSHSLWSLQEGDDLNFAVFNANSGTGWLKGIEIPAGETFRFKASFDWNRPEIVKDWSFTAWGTKSKVEVRHSEGLESKSLPFRSNQGGSTQPEET